MARFELIDHTADIGIVAHGSDLKEAFANAAFGVSSLMADLEAVAEDIRREIVVEAPDREALLVVWLNEIIYIFDAERTILKTFDVTEISENRLRASASGERIDTSRHRLKTEVKAATYHAVAVDKENGVRIQVILDV